MTGGGKSNGNDNDLNKALEMVKSPKGFESMSQYHQDLVKWSRNVDKRYAWVVLAALWLIMAATLGPYRMYGLIFAKVTNEGIYTREQASWPVAMIFTMECIFGPLVSVVCYHISFRHSMLIGGILLALGNGLTYWSDSIWIDVILIGFVQGVGFSFIFMPFMEVINNYFLKYRNIAFGFSLCGGTMSVFLWSPIFRWLLGEFPWRSAYLGFGMIGCIIVVMVPFLKPNTRPKPPICGPAVRQLRREEGIQRKGSTLSRVSFQALSFQNSQRRQSTMLISRKRSLDRQGSIISVNPFASSAGLERKISRAIADTQNQQVASPTAGSLAASNTTQQQNKLNRQSTHLSVAQMAAIDDAANDTKSLSEICQDSGNEFEMSSIWNILKTPGFHLIWYLELLYFWVFSLFCLVLVDFGIDRGCSEDQAEALLSFQSVGEIIGRLGLTILVDMQFLSNRNVVMFTLIILAVLLSVVTLMTNYIAIVSLTIAINAFASLLYILLNGLLVEFLGEQQVTIGYGMASFIVGFMIIFRPQAVGYFRDTLGSYDWLMYSLAAACILGAILCILERLATKMCNRNKDQADNTSAA